MKSTHTPVRTCAGCGKKFDKAQLLRIVRGADGDLYVDKSGKMGGRGAYICHSDKCLEKLVKNKRLSREFKMQIPAELYGALSEALCGREE